MAEPPPEDPRDALIREQAALLKEQAEQIAALTALVAELREQLLIADLAGSALSAQIMPETTLRSGPAGEKR